ncbi:MAG: acyltransferase [Prevotella sp.]|uniref:acyltransferase family protein n=1 Tax=Prevotella sp. TaxID=59823 RepID=UPI00257F7978|nr:acyltransferase family protein [Prevotella sp.]MBS5876774.1 acyltransferase [Prevotella sp.]
MKLYRRSSQVIDFDFVNGISKSRTYLMGIAILLVLIYHAMCVTYNPLRTLNIGYVGVDIFLFLSGFGLTFSYLKNSLLSFYEHRLIRLYPLYLICVCIIYYIYDNWNFIDFFYNLLTVGFYIDNGINRFDWYVESLFTLYILFPLFFIYSKLKLFGVLLLLSVISIILYVIEIPWWYDCFISRIPIFLLGIVCARFKLTLNKIIILTIIGVILFLPCFNFISKFLATSFLVLPIFLIISSIQGINKKYLDFISYFGKHSLEIYLANVLILYIYQIWDLSRINRAIVYIPFQIILSSLLIFINTKINIVIEHKR